MPVQHYVFYESDHNQSLEARFWNCGGFQIAIIASITKGIDWAAYIGADRSFTEGETLWNVKDHGCKLSEKDARHFFPEIELPYRN